MSGQEPAAAAGCADCPEGAMRSGIDVSAAPEAAGGCIRLLHVHGTRPGFVPGGDPAGRIKRLISAPVQYMGGSGIKGQVDELTGVAGLFYLIPHAHRHTPCCCTRRGLLLCCPLLQAAALPPGYMP